LIWSWPHGWQTTASHELFHKKILYNACTHFSQEASLR
jgi:hypothetical protein